MSNRSEMIAGMVTLFGSKIGNIPVAKRLDVIDALTKAAGDAEVVPISPNTNYAAGSFGVAVGLGSDKVLKLTSDPSDLEASAIVAKNPVDHVVRIFHVERIKGIRVKNSGVPMPMSSPGIVIAERLTPMRLTGLVSVSAIKALRHIADGIKILQGLFSPKIFFEKREKRVKKLVSAHKATKDEIRRFAEAFKLQLSVEDYEMFNEILIAMDNLASIGVYAFDVHPGNIGYSEREGIWKIMDLGFSVSIRRESEPDKRKPVRKLTGNPMRGRIVEDEDGVIYFIRDDRGPVEL